MLSIAKGEICATSATTASNSICVASSCARVVYSLTFIAVLIGPIRSTMFVWSANPRSDHKTSENGSAAAAAAGSVTGAAAEVDGPPPPAQPVATNARTPSGNSRRVIRFRPRFIATPNIGDRPIPHHRLNTPDTLTRTRYRRRPASRSL